MTHANAPLSIEVAAGAPTVEEVIKPKTKRRG